VQLTQHLASSDLRQRKEKWGKDDSEQDKLMEDVRSGGAHLCQKLREEVLGQDEGRGGQMAAKLQCKEDGASCCYEPPLPHLTAQRHSSTEHRESRRDSHPYGTNRNVA
jgi:hypothetical protein